MQLSSLNVTLQRINTIENQIQSLASFAQKPDSDFQKILNTKVENKNNSTNVSRAEIDNLISKYADKNGYVYINPNQYLNEFFEENDFLKYMVDVVHPNSTTGVILYSKAIFEGSK